MSDIIVSSKTTVDITDNTDVSIGIFLSSKTMVDITDNTDVSIGIFLSLSTKVTISDEDSTFINHYKSCSKYIEPNFLLATTNINTKLVVKGFNSYLYNTDYTIKATSFDFIGVDKENSDDVYKLTNLLPNISSMPFTSLIYNAFIREFIRDFNNNFEIPIGVILADKKINFYFSNLSRVTKTIKQIRIPDYTGIELDTDYSGFTVPPYGSIRISGTAKFDKGAEFVKDFLVVELESGELLRFEFVIVRQDDTIFYFAPDRGTHKEEYEIFTHDFTSLNGCQTVKLVVPTPKLTNLENTLSVDNQRDFVKIQSVIDYQHKYEMSAALWVWSFEIDPIGVVKEIPLPFAELKEIFDKSEKILIYEKNSFNKIQIGAVADVDTNKISLKASVNLENNGNNYYIVPIRKGWAADSLSTTVGMFRNGSIDMTFKEN